ncbi:hypothetical protein C7S18_06355 [Ahniella affigens]|uniref:Uncharacterized protein n=1 Tax=Ahniella affigens TaxID=2021234 RepID=A0A2P1PPS4_9GAMM|nr:hypothetical protein [Ahniella affigens]AVP96845.1 hypothetical protein C7S18_06355 [Ahniella affigens]
MSVPTSSERLKPDNPFRFEWNEMSFIQAFPFLVLTVAFGYPLMFGLGCGIGRTPELATQRTMSALCLQLEAAREPSPVLWRSVPAWLIDQSEPVSLQPVTSLIMPSALRDSWSQPFIISLRTNGATLISIGQDAMANTADDLREECRFELAASS